jgi:hypothetical protein
MLEVRRTEPEGRFLRKAVDLSRLSQVGIQSVSKRYLCLVVNETLCFRIGRVRSEI